MTRAIGKETRKQLRKQVGDGIALVRAALREIFDESAYQRFLERGGLARSAGSYAAFWAEQEKTRARRPRCC